jgi:hypothetical protein
MAEVEFGVGRWFPLARDEGGKKFGDGAGSGLGFPHPGWGQLQFDQDSGPSSPQLQQRGLPPTAWGEQFVPEDDVRQRLAQPKKMEILVHLLVFSLFYFYTIYKQSACHNITY